LPSLGWQSVIVGDPLCRPFDGVTLTPPQIGESVEPTTRLPSLFVDRWVESLRIDSPGAPREALLQVATARARLSTGDRAAAKTAFMKAVSLLPDNGDIRLQLASLQEEDGEFSAAVVSLEPRNVIALNNLAYALAVRTKELDEALTIARRAYGVAPEDPNVLDTLGWIEHLKGDPQEAATRLRAAAQRAPNSADIRLHAALVLAKAGAIAEASKHLEAALRLDPSLEGRDEVRELQRRLR
jgi:tetratricopeptide (TPR) repeat protein